MGAAPEQAGDPENGPPRSVSEFFADTVQRLLHVNIEYVLNSSLAGLDVQVLHMIDANPPPRQRLGYHYVYMTSGSTRGVTNHGIFIDKPVLRPAHQGENLPKHGDSRHYFDVGNGVLVRQDKVWGQQRFEFLGGSDELDPLRADDAEVAAALEDLHGDLANIGVGTPLRPMTNLFHNHVSIYVKP